jgi:aldehyde dehydrogenase (NAD+)/3-succinoylsemialdehyde-pyridine dehydrogenase
MIEQKRFYVNGEWVRPVEGRPFTVVNPATEKPAGRIALGSAADVDRAVQAARAAFDRGVLGPAGQRKELLRSIAGVFAARQDEIAAMITLEMGAPYQRLATTKQAPVGLKFFQLAAELLDTFAFEETMGTARVLREPVGVCALIGPWNFPIVQAVAKIAPALAAGCTMVFKPSELAPLSSGLLAQVLHDAGVPPGVFNLVNGTGPEVGAALSAHPGVDMVSFTGSTLAGKAVLRAAAENVKRVSLELGGKSPAIVVPGADLKEAVTGVVKMLLANAGQACNMPTRLLVHASQKAEAEQIALEVMRATRVGDPMDPATDMGPLANEAQYRRVLSMITQGSAEGARMLCGGTQLPDGLTQGFYVRPTLFTDVDNRMEIAQKEIFGPVLCLMTYDDLDEAVAIANDTPYGLAAYVYSRSEAEAEHLLSRLRSGTVHVNGAPPDLAAPFGGYKQSGLGRERGKHGLEEYLELKSVFGAQSR